MSIDKFVQMNVHLYLCLRYLLIFHVYIAENISTILHRLYFLAKCYLLTTIHLILSNYFSLASLQHISSLDICHTLLYSSSISTFPKIVFIEYQRLEEYFHSCLYCFFHLTDWISFAFQFFHLMNRYRNKRYYYYMLDMVTINTCV